VKFGVRILYAYLHVTLNLKTGNEWIKKFQGVHNCGYKFLKRICIIHILWTGQKYHNWPPGFGWLGLLVLLPVNWTRTKQNWTGPEPDLEFHFLVELEHPKPF
jgi:hypothetical protein